MYVFGIRPLQESRVPGQGNDGRYLLTRKLDAEEYEAHVHVLYLPCRCPYERYSRGVFPGSRSASKMSILLCSNSWCFLVWSVILCRDFCWLLKS